MDRPPAGLLLQLEAHHARRPKTVRHRFEVSRSRRWPLQAAARLAGEIVPGHTLASDGRTRLSLAGHRSGGSHSAAVLSSPRTITLE